MIGASLGGTRIIPHHGHPSLSAHNARLSLAAAAALVEINQVRVCKQGPDWPAGPIFLTGQICFEWTPEAA